MTIEKTLDSKLNNGEIISVFCNPEDNYSAAVGFLTAVDDTHFVLKHVTVAGRYDGYTLRSKDQIFRIEEKTSYENSLQKLYEYYGEKHIDFSVSKSVFTEFLNFAKRNGFIVGVGVRDYEQCSIIGFVESVNESDKTVIIHRVTDEGTVDGYSTVSFDSIVRMSCDCEKDHTIKILHSLKQ